MKKKGSLVRYLPIYGCIATGIIYGAIGVIAILSFLQIRHGGADESSMLAILNEHVVGKIFIWIILLGTLSYIAWRIYETITDPYGYGKEWQGLTKRTGIALSTVADILIVSSAVRVLVGVGNIQSDGRPVEEREMVTNLLVLDWGKLVVIAIGAIVMITAVIQFLYGVTRGYRERADIEDYRPLLKNTIHILAWAGYFARGVILGIIGFSFIKAGVDENSRYAVNTDKAFDFIGDEVGHVYFILIAIGTICYGLFMFAMGVSYDADRD